MWYPGDRGGYATASVLLVAPILAASCRSPGLRPSHRKPPTSLAMHPQRTSAGVDSSGKVCAASTGGPGTTPSCTTTYSEGIDIGYRFFDATGETPLYPFGYGLSYTSFTYSHLRVSQTGDGDLNVRFRLTDTGGAAGAEVSQVYLGAPDTKPSGCSSRTRRWPGTRAPPCGPGSRRPSPSTCPSASSSTWDTQSGTWVTAAGQRPLYVASDERSADLTTTITVRGGGH